MPPSRRNSRKSSITDDGDFFKDGVNLTRRGSTNNNRRKSISQRRTSIAEKPLKEQVELENTNVTKEIQDEPNKSEEESSVLLENIHEQGAQGGNETTSDSETESSESDISLVGFPDESAHRSLMRNTKLNMTEQKEKAELRQISFQQRSQILLERSKTLIDIKMEKKQKKKRTKVKTKEIILSSDDEFEYSEK